MAAEAATDVAVVSGRLVLEDSVAAGRIRVRGGLIVSIDLDDAEADGPYVAPGFVDVHVHGFGGHSAMGDEQALDGMARALLRRGVTSFLPTAVTAPMAELGAFAERIRRWRPAAPRDGALPLGFNLEGPFISRMMKGAQNPQFIIEPSAVSDIDLEPLYDGLRLMTIAPELPGATDLIARLRKRGIATSLGHSAATAREAIDGYRAGATGTTHLFNGMTGVDHHSPGLGAAALVADEAWVELVADGFHVDRAIWPLITRMKPPSRLVLVSDAIPLGGSSARSGVVGGLDVQVRGRRCLLVSNGRLAGSLIALDEAVRNLVRAGVSLPLAVGAATRNPLALIGERGRGRLAPGYRADLVELDESLAIRRVMRDGRWCADPDAIAVGWRPSRLKGHQRRSEPAQKPEHKAHAGG
jgi:N-acetylglucosamine-6-phosphate deacetylase